MYDDCAEIVRGMIGPVSVRKKKRAASPAPVIGGEESER
jgi:hypothetical protein